jgi:O-antigen/teichoic acid export membrane protein
VKDTAGRTVTVAVGVVCNGAGTIVMLAIASRVLTVDDFATFSTWWIAATLVIFPLGVFEALLTRQVVSDVVAGVPAKLGTSAVAARATSVVAPVAVALAAAAPLVGAALFEDAEVAALALAGYLLVGFVQTLERGHAAGVDRFGVVAALLALDGGFRTVGVIACAVLGLTSPVAISLAVLLGSGLTAVVGHMLLRDWLGRSRGRKPSFKTTTALLMLAGASGPMLINNASVPWLSGRGADAALVGAFSGALTLSRVPIQLGGAAFGPLLRRFAHAIDVGDAARERADFRGAVTGAVGVALVFVLGFSLLAPPFISLYLGSAYDVPRWVCALLAVSSGAMLVAVVAQVRAAAQERWRAISYSWLLAAGVFVCTLFTPGDLLLRCSLAPTTASLAGLAALIVVGRRASTGQPAAAT